MRTSARVKICRRQTLRWPAVGLLNLCVRLTAGGEVEIRRFKRCPFCDHPQPGVEISKPWAAWYRSLALVAIHSQR